jgi:hypothetical protein
MVRRFINASKIEIHQKNPTAVRHGGKDLTPWPTTVRAVASGSRPIPPCRAAVGPLPRGSRRHMYSFAKIRADHIFFAK